MSDVLWAYCFDRAVATFGTLVENEMTTAAEGKNAKQAEMSRNMVLIKWVPELAAGRFRTPTATKRR